MTLVNDARRQHRTISLGRRIKAARTLSGLEQIELAELIGIGRASIGSWERGETQPNATQFVRIARATGMTIEWLAEGINDELAPAGAGANFVHPLGLEPRTHCFRVYETADELISFWDSLSEASVH